jgi:FlaG/FlaF family flagellin (archaellin)
MKTILKEHAVSPVVGVMLMLVVTIIIAAVVSAFAGDMSSSQAKTPITQIQASYSQSGGMEIVNNGGDVLSTQDIYLVVRDSNNMGSQVSTWASTVNKSLIQNTSTTTSSTKFWVNATYGGVEVSRWAPGDTMYITAANCQPALLQPQIHNYGAAYHSTGDAWTISSPTQIGSTFYLELYTTNNKMISQVEVPIKP